MPTDGVTQSKVRTVTYTGTNVRDLFAVPAKTSITGLTLDIPGKMLQEQIILSSCIDRYKQSNSFRHIIMIQNGIMVA